MKALEIQGKDWKVSFESFYPEKIKTAKRSSLTGGASMLHY